MSLSLNEDFQKSTIAYCKLFFHDETMNSLGEEETFTIYDRKWGRHLFLGHCNALSVRPAIICNRTSCQI